ncbi:MAG: archaemetzincin family Zn-dependent metalloprotease [Methanomassiliicoccales archaeon]|nr:archaemetzincin family Zn-dependent metalloprotease [Methanomassiliicoccales archaeon]
MDNEVLLVLLSKLGERFGSGMLLSPVDIPRESYDRQRGQYDSAILLKLAAAAQGERVLGITSVDMFAPGLNFVFGRALLGGKGCIISIARLRHQDPGIFADRTIKEAVHELGHTFGLDHCSNPGCVMFFSNSILDTDRKGDGFCRRCESDLERIGAKQGIRG